MPSVLAVLPKTRTPSSVLTGTTVQQVADVKSYCQLLVQECMAQTDIDRVAMTRVTLCYYARRAVVSGQLTAEILGEQELCIQPNRRCEDILSC